jgi:hypothetical protein
MSAMLTYFCFIVTQNDASAKGSCGRAPFGRVLLRLSPKRVVMKATISGLTRSGKMDEATGFQARKGRP